MALRSPYSTRQQDVVPRDSPPVDSPPPTSQGRSSNGAKAEVARKKKEEADHLLAKLEKEGIEIDDKIASIIDDGLARIKAEATRENINEPDKWMLGLLIYTCVAVGYFMGIDWELNSLHKKLSKRRHC